MVMVVLATVAMAVMAMVPVAMVMVVLPMVVQVTATTVVVIPAILLMICLVVLEASAVFNSEQGQSSQYYGQDASYYTAASNYINNRHFQEALNVLNNIQDRTAQWYFLSALANNGLGNNVMALDLAKTALQMEPDNQTYQRLVQTLESGGQWYNTRQYSYGGNSGAMCCADPCTTLCLLNMCCC